MKKAGIVNNPVGITKNRIANSIRIGIHPNFIGKGLGTNLHSIGLYRLKNEFNAKSYLGMTQVDNIQMGKIMVSNGCMQNENTVISLEYSAGQEGL